MSVLSFFKRRLIRLHPMVVMGTLIGASLYFFGQCEEFPLIGHVSGWKVFVAFLMGVLMIPCGPGMDIRGWEETNSFNGPNWSLTWEYVANILYILLLQRLPKTILTVLAVVAAFFTLDICLHWNCFGFLTDNHIPRMYTVIGGWSLTVEQIYIAATRLLFPFLSGLLLSRCGKFLAIKGGFWWCSLSLVVVFSIPCVGGEGSILNGYYNAACILILFPLLLMVGAGSKMVGERSMKICNFLGEISYPLYITHFPLMYMQMNWVWSHTDAPFYAHIMVSGGCFVLSIMMAYACMQLYDKPVRKWLTEKFMMKKTPYS